VRDRLEPIATAAVRDPVQRVDELLDVEDARALLAAEFGAEATSLADLEARNALFCVVCAGAQLYPAFQWREGRLIGSVAEILDILTPYRSSWKILSWFSQQNGALGGATPADLLISAPQAVAVAARIELRARQHPTG
jgi:Protein of unknown function (DUF2384)